MRDRRPLLIGITGNIGTGKSTVAKMLAEMGAYTIDADQVVHEVMAKGTPVHAAIIETFGPEVLADTRQSSARGSELRSALDLARLLVNRDRPFEAREILSRSLGGFREGRSTPDVQAAWSTLRSLESS